MKALAPDFKPPEMNERRATGHHNHGTWEIRCTPYKKTVDLSNPNCIVDFLQTPIRVRFLSQIVPTSATNHNLSS